jgi:hypothetical protein
LYKNKNKNLVLVWFLKYYKFDSNSKTNQTQIWFLLIGIGINDFNYYWASLGFGVLRVSRFLVVKTKPNLDLIFGNTVKTRF